VLLEGVEVSLGGVLQHRCEVVIACDLGTQGMDRNRDREKEMEVAVAVAVGNSPMRLS